MWLKSIHLSIVSFSVLVWIKIYQNRSGPSLISFSVIKPSLQSFAFSVLGDGATDLGFVIDLRVALLGAALFFLTEVHRLALDNLALGYTDLGRIHSDRLTVHVEEDGRRGLDNARHKRVLDQLEVELLGRVVAERRVIVRQVELEEVRAAESVRVDALRGQRVNVVIVTGMLAKEASSRGVVSLGADLELDNHLF